MAAPPPNLLSLARHVHVAQLAGDLQWRRDRGDCVRGGARHAAAPLAIDEETYIEALTSRAELLWEAATIFNLNLGDTTAMSLIVTHAREALATPGLYGSKQLSLRRLLRPPLPARALSTTNLPACITATTSTDCSMLYLQVHEGATRHYRSLAFEWTDLTTLWRASVKNRTALSV